MANWASDSNEALQLSLVRASADKENLAPEEDYEQFHPTFTYPIYGEDEKVYGYQDLVIDLRFSSGSLAYYLDVKYSDKLNSTTVDDVEKTLAEFIPDDYIKDEATFLSRVEDDALSFKPCGELIHSYTRSSRLGKGKAKESAAVDPASDDAVAFEVYHASWDTPGFKEYHRRMQLFILLYIEAGSYINEDEDPWEFVVLYEKRKRKGTDIYTYHFVGYSSLYNFYFYPDRTRLRLSQFVILPPYQRAGHGSALYSALYNYVLAQPHIAELTVEDPAEAFEDLRDRNDLRMLQAHTRFLEEAFGGAEVSYGGGRVGGVGKGGKSGRGGKGKVSAKGKMAPPIDKPWAENWRVQMKIALRQFQRLTEMLMLLRLDPTDKNSLKAYRLQVKERLYRFNFEVLAQLEKPERLEKLEETFENVIEDYQRILEMIR